MDKVRADWRAPTLYSECSWHQLSPYIGRMKSSMARSLVTQFTKPGDWIYDPFSGAGTVALEGWLNGRNVIAADLSPYAHVLTSGKLHPPRSLQDATRKLDMYWQEASSEADSIDLSRVPTWVRAFFHRRTLRELLAIRDVLVAHRQWFLLSCLLGILHHWRPAFLSHPASHMVPYLMTKLYPREAHPRLYRYKAVYPRLQGKLRRAFARTTDVDRHLTRVAKEEDAKAPGSILNGQQVSAIITSPPYMNSLSYARDNRLRLWLLGVQDYRKLEPALSPRKQAFLAMMRTVIPIWSQVLPKSGPCILVLGATRHDGRYHNLPEEAADLVRDLNCGFRVTAICRNVIPDRRRARGSCCSVRQETILVLRKWR